MNLPRMARSNPAAHLPGSRTCCWPTASGSIPPPPSATISRARPAPHDGSGTGHWQNQGHPGAGATAGPYRPGAPGLHPQADHAPVSGKPGAGDRGFEREGHAGQRPVVARDRRRRLLRVPAPAPIQGTALRHGNRAGRPLISIQQAVLKLRDQKRQPCPGRAELDLRRLRRTPRPRRQCGHQFATAHHRRPRGAHGATRGESGGDAGHCRRNVSGGRRESHACQARARSAGRLGQEQDGVHYCPRP